LGRKPIPRPSFLDDCDYRRWRSKNGKRLFTWDSLHGEIEVFDLLGRHIAVLNAAGEWRKGPVSGRRIDV
jgi:hypothetical protein